MELAHRGEIVRIGFQVGGPEFKPQLCVPGMPAYILKPINTNPLHRVHNTKQKDVGKSKLYTLVVLYL